MVLSQKVVDYLAAASIVVAFGGLFFGRLMIYPVSRAPGDFLERVAAESAAWDFGHRWMLVGMISLIPAAIALRRAMHERSPWLTDAATILTILGASLGVGQYALDFAMLAAAEISSPEARSQFGSALSTNAFVQWAFYKLPDLAQLGLILLTVALWRQGFGWRLQATLVTLAAMVALIGPIFLGSTGSRVGLGLLFVGFSTVAWRIAGGGAKDSTPVDAGC